MRTGIFPIGTTADLFADRNGVPIPGMTEADEIREIAKIGFEALDFGMYWHQGKDGKFWGNDWQDYAKGLADAAKESGIVFSQTHSPMFNMKENADAAEQLMLTKRSFEISRILEAPYMVIHPQFPFEGNYGANHDELMQYNLEFFKPLTELAAKTGVKIAVENMFGYDPVKNKICPTFFSHASDLLEFLDLVNGREYFGVCFDTGHANLVDGDTPGKYIRKLGRNLKVLHTHDNRGSNDDHMPPYIGNIDWTDTILALRQVDYDGVLSLEAETLANDMPPVFEIKRQSAVLTYQLGKQIASL